MEYFRPSSSTHQPLDDARPATKRISTPAGQRLSLIVESAQSKRPKSPASKINVTTTSTYCNDPTHQHIEPVQHGHNKASKRPGVASVFTSGRLDTPRESTEHRNNPNGSSLSVSVWSDKDGEKFRLLRHGKPACVSTWNKKRVAMIAALVLTLIIALAVGLGVGLKKKSPSSSTASTTDDSHSTSPNPSSSNSPDTDTDQPPMPTATVAPSSLPSGFPVGTYSFIVFLDTVQTDCTANNATWTCPPYTNYYISPQQALTILNWKITGSPGSYKISSDGEDPTFGISFQNENLDLLAVGQPDERYRFRMSRTKSVNMTGSIGDTQGSFECDYFNTNIQGSLYTKMPRTYPKDTISLGKTSHPNWPFAIRIEQTVAGGDGVPACKKSGQRVYGGLDAQDATTLCSCLYKNWTPV